MQRRRGVLAIGLAVGLTLGALPLATHEAAAQILDIGIDLDGEDCGIVALALCTTADSESGRGGDATSTGGDGGNGGRGGNGGFASVHDIANAHAAATSSVIIGDIETGNAFGHTISVDATGADDPVVLAIAGSFSDTGVDVFAPGGNAQAGTTGGYGINADASGGAGGAGGDGGDATSRGGNSGDSESCAAGLLGCFDASLTLDLLG